MSTEPTQNVLKGATLAWDVTAMSGTSKRVTSALLMAEALYSASWQVAWANTLAVLGAFDVEESNDGLVWVAAGITGPTVNANTGDAIITHETAAKYVRLVYTNTSGTGTLGAVTVQGKQLMASEAQLAQLDDATADVLTAQATADAALEPTTTHDLSGINAATAAFKVTATSDTPAVTWTDGVPSTNPSGHVKIDVGGVVKYQPYWD